MQLEHRSFGVFYLSIRAIICRQGEAPGYNGGMMQAHPF